MAKRTRPREPSFHKKIYALSGWGAAGPGSDADALLVQGYRFELAGAHHELDGFGVPADTFTSDAIVTPLLEFPTLYPGTNITLVVTNIDAAPHTFLANWWGVSEGRRE